MAKAIGTLMVVAVLFLGGVYAVKHVENQKSVRGMCIMASGVVLGYHLRNPDWPVDFGPKHNKIMSFSEVNMAQLKDLDQASSDAFDSDIEESGAGFMAACSLVVNQETTFSARATRLGNLIDAMYAENIPFDMGKMPKTFFVDFENRNRPVYR
jgi:hypothetical protein